jgi:hypothetical protein
MPELWRSLIIQPSFRLPHYKQPTDGDNLGALDAEQGGVVCEHYVSLVKGWFGRAKEQPLLSLYFWFDMKEEWSELHRNNSISLISEILVANAPRFRYLDVSASRAMYLQNFLTDSSSVKLNHLESLVIRIPDLDNVGLGVITTLRSTPNLRRVALQTLTPDWPSLLPWSQLTHLRATNPIPPYTWISLLRECINLQSGAFYIRTEAVEPARLPENFTHSWLSYLHVVFLDGKTFRNLHLPALQTLKLHSFIGVTQSTGPLFPNLHQLMPSLTTLSLMNLAIKADDLLDLLRVSQNLINFEFAGSSGVDHELLFKHMCYVGSNNTVIEILLPKLESLSVHVPALEGLEEPFPTNAFVDMIKSRRNPESTAIHGTLSCLSHLTFSARDKDALEEVERTLAPYCHDGIFGTFDVITNQHWGHYTMYLNVEHWY